MCTDWPWLARDLPLMKILPLAEILASWACANLPLAEILVSWACTNLPLEILVSWVCTDWPLVDRGLTLLLVETVILELICTTLASLGTVTPWAGLGVFWFWALIFFLFLIFNFFSVHTDVRMIMMTLTGQQVERGKVRWQQQRERMQWIL